MSDTDWIKNYLTIHSLRKISHFYAYTFWAVLLAILFLATIIRIYNFRDSYFILQWNKQTLRKGSWTNRFTRQLNFLPSYAQIWVISALVIVSAAFAFVGPDTLISDGTSRNIVIYKSWWSSAARSGLAAFALLPLCIVFGLKAPPFAFFASSFTTQLYFDKLAILHRWTARLVWFLTFLHVVFWSVQLFIDRANDGRLAYKHAWGYNNFVFGWIAFFLLTAIIALSSSSLRRPHYEVFYAFHVLFVPLMLITCALHRPQMWWWSVSALIIWVCERSWRAARYMYYNSLPSTNIYHCETNPSLPDFGQEHNLVVPLVYLPKPPSNGREIPPPQCRSLPPPGFVYAELLAGATVRLNFVPAKPLAWAPGQHFLINIPSVSKYTSHPFSTCSIYDINVPAVKQTMTFLIRVKNGWTLDLWDRVFHLCAAGQTHLPGEKPLIKGDLPENSVLMRMKIDGPFGSSARVHWGSYSTVLIVVGGSGISFGLSVLEYACLLLAGRNGKSLGGKEDTRGVTIERVRLVWLIQDYSHIQWCAATLAHYMGMLSRQELEVNIFVTKQKLPRGPYTQFPSEPLPIDPELAPPMPHFIHSTGRSRSNSPAGNDSDDSLVESGQPRGSDDTIQASCVGPQQNLNLTSFGDENEVELPGESNLNRSIKREGKLRRAISRKRDQQWQNLSENQRSIEAELWPQHDKVKSQHTTMQSTSSTLCEQGGGNFQSSYNSESRKETSLGEPEPKIWTHEGHRKSSSSDLPCPPEMCTPRPTLPSGDKRLQEPNPRLRVDSRDIREVSYMSEHARPGRPKIDRIIRDELKAAAGPIVVACCGPESLGVLVRETVASLINLDVIRRERGGRGMIDFVSEEFDY